MRFYKVVDGGCIVEIGIGIKATEITETEYNEILMVIKSIPKDIDYKLHDDLTWEEVEVLPVESEPTIEDILSILTGESE